MFFVAMTTEAFILKLHYTWNFTRYVGDNFSRNNIFYWNSTVTITITMHSYPLMDGQGPLVNSERERNVAVMAQPCENMSSYF